MHPQPEQKPVSFQLPEPSLDRISVATPERGYRSITQRNKMDPFEVRIRFSDQLVHLNASVTSANKAAKYALKYKDMDEDLHSCILEQLEKNSMNNRANIMYFVQELCDMASREKHFDYIRMMERDIIRIVDAVAPEDGSGAANVKVVRKVLKALEAKSFLTSQTICEIEECLKERDVAPDSMGFSSPAGPTDTVMTGVPTSSTPKLKPSSFQRLDKKQAEQRIEEDRERHKRERETAWAVPKSHKQGGWLDEFDQLWDETSDVGEDDFELYREETQERARNAAEWKEAHAKGATGSGE